MKKIKIFLLFTLLLVIPFLFSSSAKAKTVLDYIEKYEIKVDLRSDATLDMEYYIKWKVLDSDTDGPLSWVKIGVPNKYVDELQSHSDSIKKISYLADNGAFIRLDLDREYYKDEVVILHFSFHQSHMFRLDDERVYFDFMPGWFDEIEVGNITIKWNLNNVSYASTNVTSDGYYIFGNKRLNAGERITIGLNYMRDAFPNININDTYTDDDGDVTKYILIIFLCVIVIVFIIIIFIVIIEKKHSYYSYRGFSGPRGYYFFHHGHHHNSGYGYSGKKLEIPNTAGNKSGYSGSGRSCACACACACAGGGRAGCSRKDFYNTNLNTDTLEKVLIEKNRK